MSGKESIEFLDRFVFTHVAHPQEKCNETDEDEKFVEKRSKWRNNLEESFKQVAQEIPEAVHGLLIYRTNIEIRH